MHYVEQHTWKVWQDKCIHFHYSILTESWAKFYCKEQRPLSSSPRALTSTTGYSTSQRLEDRYLAPKMFSQLAIRTERKLQSRVQREFSELQPIADRSAGVSTYVAKTVLFWGARVGDSTIIILSHPSSIASQGRYFNPYVIGIDHVPSSFC